MSKDYEVPESVLAFLEEAGMDIIVAPQDKPAWRLVGAEWGDTDREARVRLLNQDGLPVDEPRVFWAFSSGENSLSARAYPWVPSQYRKGRSVRPGGFVLSSDWTPLGTEDAPSTAVFVQGELSDIVLSPNLRFGAEGRSHTAPHLTFRWIDPNYIPAGQRLDALEGEVAALKARIETLKAAK